MLNLLTHYLEYPTFWLLHISLLIYSSFRLNQTRQNLKKDQVLFKKLVVGGIDFLRNIHTHTIEEQLKKQPIYHRLLVIPALLDQSKQSQLSHMVDEYESDHEASIDWLDRITNVFLLSGIIGTLFGMFSSLSQNQNAIDLTLILKEAFSAFGITIFAVFFTAILYIFEIIIRSMLQQNINDLNTFLIPLQAYQSPIEQRPEYEIQKLLLVELNQILAQLKESLESPENITRTFVELKDLIASIAKNLNQSSLALDGYAQHIEKLPKQTDHSFRMILASFEEALKKMQSNVSNYSNNAGQVFQLQRAHLEDLEVKTQGLNQEALKQLSENVRISREFFGQLGKAYEDKLSSTLSSSHQHTDEISSLLIDLTKKFDRFANQLQNASDSMRSFVEKTAQLDEKIQEIKAPFLNVEQSISMLSAQMNQFFTTLQSNLQETQSSQFKSMQKGLNQNLMVIAVFSLGISLLVPYLQNSGQEKISQESPQAKISQESPQAKISQEKTSQSNHDQSKTRSCVMIDQFIKIDAPKTLPNLYQFISKDPKNKPYANHCISKDELLLLKNFDKNTKKFYVHVQYTSTNANDGCHLAFNREPSDFINLMKNEFDLKKQQTIKDLNDFIIKIDCIPPGNSTNQQINKSTNQQINK